ncbi:MAG TPA: hypothetical protein PLL53_08675 [Saprospiraceae bacterium]|nr:hypothetical protein [Saprospiraceae bacterium]
MKPFIAACTIVMCMYSLSARAQSWEWGAHLGATYSKMLWADKVEDNPWVFIQYPETQFRLSYALGLSSSYRYSTRWYGPFQLDFYNKRFSVSTGGRGNAFDDNGQSAIF